MGKTAISLEKVHKNRRPAFAFPHRLCYNLKKFPPLGKKGLVNVMALKVGIQLYSVRDEMAKDPVEAIRQVAEIGYKNLEVANSRAAEDPGVGFDVPADKLLEILGGFGAKVVSSHISPINEETLPAIMEYHGKIGNKYIGQSADFFADYDALQRRCEYYNKMGKILSQNGMKFLYHNHYHEFQNMNGQYILYQIAENTDPDYVDVEVDTFWAMRGGADPVEVINHLGKRLRMIHQKDFSKTTDSPINIFSVKDPNVIVTRDTFGGVHKREDFCEVGTGIMPIQEILDAANAQGAEYVILEQDFTQLSQMESVKISMDSFHKYNGIEWD